MHLIVLALPAKTAVDASRVVRVERSRAPNSPRAMTAG
jgi:hypothetical protein